MAHAPTKHLVLRAVLNDASSIVARVIALGDHQILVAPNKRVRRPPPVAYREVSLPGLDSSSTFSDEKTPPRGRGSPLTLE